ncbi:DUF1071 domain-containing protein, partial [Staphylococcus aureus]
RDVSAHVEKKQNLNYLSWAYVQQELTKEDPNYTERVIEFPYPDSNNENFFVPYLKTNEGYMVCVELTVFGVTKREWLPVLDYRNKPVRDVSAHVEKKQNLNYLSWAYVQQELTKEDPNYT